MCELIQTVYTHIGIYTRSTQIHIRTHTNIERWDIGKSDFEFKFKFDDN